MSGPKADRLKLFRATGMNLSPVFGLYPDAANDVFGRLEPLLHRTLPLEATDHLGVVSRLWPVTDERVIGAVVSGMADKPVFIADGHHRYETGPALPGGSAGRRAGRDDDAPANFVLMMLVTMSDPGLVILPTHRLVTGFPGLTAGQLKTALGQHFEVERVGVGPGGLGGRRGRRHAGAARLRHRGRRRLADGPVRQPGADGRAGRRPQPGVARPGGQRPARGGPGQADPGGGRRLGQLQVRPSAGEVEERVAAGGCQLAALVPPATMEHVEEIAGNREKMPPKSTYFYPKLLTGLVFNSLKAN